MVPFICDTECIFYYSSSQPGAWERPKGHKINLWGHEMIKLRLPLIVTYWKVSSSWASKNLSY